MSTPGTMGSPGKWPRKKSSRPLRLQTASPDSPGISVVSFVRNRKGGRWGKSASTCSSSPEAPRAAADEHGGEDRLSFLSASIRVHPWLLAQSPVDKRRERRDVLEGLAPDGPVGDLDPELLFYAGDQQ